MPRWPYSLPREREVAPKIHGRTILADQRLLGASSTSAVEVAMMQL